MCSIFFERSILSKTTMTIHISIYQQQMEILSAVTLPSLTISSPKTWECSCVDFSLDSVPLNYLYRVFNLLEDAETDQNVQRARDVDRPSAGVPGNRR